MAYKGNMKKGLKIFYVLTLFILLGTLGISIYTLNEVKGLKSIIIPKTIPIKEFLEKLTAHDELKNYNNIPPLNIIRIDSTNLGNLQAQINGLDTSYIGKYIVMYTDRLVIYDFDNDEIVGNLASTNQGAQLPQDFFNKLLKHPELKDVEKMNPTGGIIDQASLDTLKQQFPDVYKDAKVGNYLLRYTDRLIIYDYQNDNIVSAFAIQQSSE